MGKAGRETRQGLRKIIRVDNSGGEGTAVSRGGGGGNSVLIVKAEGRV